MARFDQTGDLRVKNELANIRDSHLRSILKAISWRFIATMTTGIIAFLVTGRLDMAIAIGSLEFLLKIIFYYMHERAWQLVPLGTVRSMYRWLVPSKQPRQNP
jgi:uncharacterized membrane protein